MKFKPQLSLMMINILAILVMAPTQVNADAVSDWHSISSAYKKLVAPPARIPTAAFTNNVVMEWNATAASLATSAVPALAPVQQTRVMAIVQVAVHDAVNGITGEYATYLSPGPAPAGASAEAAAIAAAHHALRTLFSSQAGTLDGLYDLSLFTNGILDDDPGLAYGQAAAAAILAARATDKAAQAQFDYIVPGAGAPGVWTRINNAPALLPGWGNVTPFVLHSASQFRPEAPPALDSEQYSRDYNEVKEIGSMNSSVRTALQTNIALFWRGSPVQIWNPVLTQLLATRNLNLSETARSFALMYLAATDSGIACWEAKYIYNYWRPELAIRGGDLDGNALTTGDATWTPRLPTPPHPEYISGHSTNSTAIGTMLTFMFGDNQEAPIVVTLTGVTRQWSSLSEPIAEVIEARIYSGIHFRTADEAGSRVGRQVARFVFTHALRPTRP